VQQTPTVHCLLIVHIVIMTAGAQKMWNHSRFGDNLALHQDVFNECWRHHADLRGYGNPVHYLTAQTHTSWVAKC